MKQNASTALLSAFQGLRISPVSIARRPTLIRGATVSIPTITTPSIRSDVRPFSSTPSRPSWLEPRMDRRKKMMKGRPRVATGGSTKGTTVVWGDYGLRMWDHHRRISAKQLKVAEDTIKQRLRGQRYRLYKRVSCNVGVYVSGNEVSRRCLFPCSHGSRELTRILRCEWVKEKVLSTIGRRGLPSIKYCSSSGAPSTNRSFGMPSV